MPTVHSLSAHQEKQNIMAATLLSVQFEFLLCMQNYSTASIANNRLLT